MTKPVRLQLSRRKGFHLQKASLAVNGRRAVNIARPSKWGNPFRVGVDGTRAECVRMHGLLLAGYICLSGNVQPQEQIAHRKFVSANLWRLHGKNLACWCQGPPCHGETLLTLAAAAEKKAA
jgi:hypothetical protein